VSKSNESSSSIKCREIHDWLTRSSATDCVAELGGSINRYELHEGEKSPLFRTCTELYIR
jgi:hypothetical protein